MKAAARQEDLQVLGQILQERLHSEIPQANSLKTGCAIKDETLIVLTQHSAELTLNPEQTFAVLQQTLQSLQPQVAQPVKLYLRVAGQKQTYAKYSFTLQPIEAAGQKGSGAEEQRGRGVEENFITTQHSPLITHYSPAAEMQVSGEEKPHTPYTPQNQFSQAKKPQHPTASAKSQYQAGLKRQPRLLMLLVVVGAGVGLATLFIATYMLTRPCVVGGCKPIQTASGLNKESARLTREAKSQPDLAVAQNWLAQATNLIKPIPWWSPYYQQAQQLSQSLSKQSATLNLALTGLQKASVAQKNQKPPHSALEWQQIRGLWLEAIAPLEAVSQTSAVYPLVQRKLPEYRDNLKLVNQQFQSEQAAIKKLLQAKSTMQIAAQRQNTVRSLQDWKQLKSDWQQVENTLVAIPKTSTAYKEAQQLLDTYRPMLTAVRDRTSKEQTAAKVYDQAFRLANLATRYEQQNQLTKALTNWSQALNYVKKIPRGTFYYTQAQPLIASYSSALKRTEDKLKVAKNLQKAGAELAQTCSDRIQVCKYSLNSQLILVQLTSNYEQVVDRGFFTASLQGNSQPPTDTAINYQTLQQALEAVSNKANLPLQIYNAQGSIIHTYKPGV